MNLWPRTMLRPLKNIPVMAHEVGGGSGLAGVVLILEGGQMPDGHNNWLLFAVW